MNTILKLSAYESTSLMVMLFLVSFSAIALMLCVASDNKKAPMHYFLAKPELPQDDDIDKASYWVWAIIGIVAIWYFI